MEVSNKNGELYNDLFVWIEAKRAASGQVKPEDSIELNEAPGNYLSREELNYFDEFFVNCVAVYDEGSESPLHEGGATPNTALENGADRIYYSLMGRKREDVLSHLDDPWWPLHDLDSELEANQLCDKLDSYLS